MNDTLDPILQQEEQRKLRMQLIWRLGIAATLVATVLGTLTWLDKDSSAVPKLSVRTYEGKIASGTASAIASLTPAINPHPEQTDAVAASAPDTGILHASGPASASSPIEQGQAPTPHEKGNIRAQPALMPALPLPASPAKAAGDTRDLSAKGTGPAQAVRTPQQVTPAPMPTSNIRQFPAPIATPNGYIVQAGVFLHSNNAEKLLRQMQAVGIPAYLETRVQIGPFSSKSDADAATRKLRQLGIEPIIKTN